MNYTEDTIEEILQEVGKDKQDELSFLTAVTKLIGSIELYKGHTFSLVYECKTRQIALKICDLIKELFNIDVEINFSSSDSNLCSLIVEGKKANDMLHQMHLSHFENDKYIVDDNCSYIESMTNYAKVQSYMQGVFVSVGSVYFPGGIEQERGYHLELSFTEENYALCLKKKLEECNLNLSYIDRETTYALYTKSSEHVQDILAFLKAMKSVIKLSEVNVEREVNNKLNRTSNIMASNVDKTMSANIKYIELIEKVIAHFGYDKLDEKTAMVCRARLEDKQSSMSVLSKKLNITKSSLNRALKKIEKMAEEIEG